MSFMCSSVIGVEAARMNAIGWSLGDMRDLELMMILISFPECEHSLLDVSMELKKGGYIKPN